MLKKNRNKSPNEQVVMQIVQNGKVRDVTARELLLSQNLSLEALTSVLVRKGLVTADELLEEIDTIRRAHAGKKPPDDASDE